MPSKNVVKIYVENGYYHIYNRGVEKRNIFLDIQDYKVFQKYLKEYLNPNPDPNTLIQTFSLRGSTFKDLARQPKNYHKKMELLAYCLMPNHFHLLVKQKIKKVMKSFMQSLLTRYSIYFNKRYERVGPLFQGTYKAVLIKDEPYLLHLSRYIHLNPSEHTRNLTKAFSSYSEYLRIKKTKWLNTEFILSFFNEAKLPFLLKTNSYRAFVEKSKEDSKEFLGDMILE